MSRNARRRAVAVGAALCLIGAMALAAPGATALTGSGFESTDGNTAKQAGYDWDSLAPATSLADQPDSPSGAGDESFTQGTKSDTAVPTIETGSIPPNKSDLTRMRIATETIDGDVYLYVAWNRTNTLGSANMNFEFNAGSTASPNGVTPVRTDGDVLITFDFASGGNKVELGLARWGDGTWPDVCVANGAKFPNCWAGFVDLDAAGIADGSVSGDQRFGEAAINLTEAGVFATDECSLFASAYLTSRSSDSFTAALKDFVPPASLDSQNCGAFAIHKTAKHFDPNSDPALVAEFTITKQGDAAFERTVYTDADGYVCVASLLPGTYDVDETDGPEGYLLDDDTESAVVTTASTCDDTSVSFENQPLSKIGVTFESKVLGGTAATITCQSGGETLDPDAGADTGDSSDPVVYDDTAETYDDLLEGTYICTIVIDP